MIKFFRKTRERSVADNRFGRYLIYAVGEIVLVVIGILIALQVNNWNEERKNINEEKISLERLHVESESVVAYLNHSVEAYNQLIQSVERSAKALHNKTLDSLSEKDFALGIYITAYYEAITPPKDVFEELNSTGKIQNIRSELIRKSISNYYSKLDFANNQLVYFRNQFTKPVEAAGEDFIYKYDDTATKKIKASANFLQLSYNEVFISKHVKALRDLIVFNQIRIELLKLAQNMCQEISTAINKKCGQYKLMKNSKYLLE